MADQAAPELAPVREGEDLDWSRIEAYLRDKPKGKFGKHEYTLEEYGLSEQAVEEAYGGYTAHYGVEKESQ